MKSRTNTMKSRPAKTRNTYWLMMACRMGNEKATKRKAKQPSMLANANAVPREFCRNTSVAYMPGMAPMARANSVMKIRMHTIEAYEIIQLASFKTKINKIV